MLNAEQRQQVEAILRCSITKLLFDALQFRERVPFSCAIGNQHAEIDFQDNFDVRECLRYIPVLWEQIHPYLLGLFWLIIAGFAGFERLE